MLRDHLNDNLCVPKLTVCREKSTKSPPIDLLLPGWSHGMRYPWKLVPHPNDTACVEQVIFMNWTLQNLWAKHDFNIVNYNCV